MRVCVFVANVHGEESHNFVRGFRGDDGYGGVLDEVSEVEFAKQLALARTAEKKLQKGWQGGR